MVTQMGLAPDQDDLAEAIAAANAHPLGSRENPVRVGGPEGERAYLARLRCGDGNAPRIGEGVDMGVGAFGSIVDGFRLGPRAPEHRAIVDGDEKSAAIAAASIVAKVVRDRTMRRLAALYPHYGFSSHVGYITPGHSAVVRERGPSVIHRRSFEARCYAPAELADTA
jgi:hypothetical protein